MTHDPHPADPNVYHRKFDPVVVRNRHDGWTPARQSDFIAALGETGCVVDACRAVGMSSESAYRLRGRFDAVDFRRAWAAALDYAVDRLEDAALSRALHGVAVPHYYKGEVVGEHRRFDEGLTRFILRYRRPTTYARHWDRQPVAGGHPEQEAEKFAVGCDAVRRDVSRTRFDVETAGWLEYGAEGAEDDHAAAVEEGAPAARVAELLARARDWAAARDAHFDTMGRAIVARIEDEYADPLAYRTARRPDANGSGPPQGAIFPDVARPSSTSSPAPGGATELGAADRGAGAPATAAPHADPLAAAATEPTTAAGECGGVGAAPCRRVDAEGCGDDHVAGACAAAADSAAARAAAGAGVAAGHPSSCPPGSADADDGFAAAAHPADRDWMPLPAIPRTADEELLYRYLARSMNSE